MEKEKIYNANDYADLSEAIVDMHQFIKFEELALKMREINFSRPDLEQMLRMMQNLEKSDDDIEKAISLLQRQQQVMYFMVVIFKFNEVNQRMIIDTIKTALSEYSELF